ncbi:MAG: hypothetical protein IH856_22820 [Deltaproteobacteria bacterium]|nr:hypothetical protein [Deltaproteobacteria bacterium]
MDASDAAVLRASSASSLLDFAVVRRANLLIGDIRRLTDLRIGAVHLRLVFVLSALGQGIDGDHKLAAVAQAHFEGAMEGIGDKDYRVFVRTLRRILDNVRRSTLT